MKIYNVAKDTPCFVVPDAAAKHAGLKSFFTRKDLTFSDVAFDNIRNHNQGTTGFYEHCKSQGWNEKLIDKIISSVTARNMAVFQEQNCNGATSLLVVAQQDVEVLA